MQPAVIAPTQPAVVQQQVPMTTTPVIEANYVATNLPSTAVVTGTPTISYIP